ncbi:DnaD domain protein [Gemella cuniculi]|uniref:DnaD domain protein n=1 Tax=Gemella cuniculi TaxID=150240 RepID=UPI0003F7977B|nr:DnaD domain protein [Gemella cuniculi]
MVSNFSQKDFYCVYNDFDLSFCVKELNLLYLPLVGSDAIKLYQFLGTKILGEKNLSSNFLHYDIFDNLLFDINKFTIARKKLEAMGLLQTYYINNDGVGQYVYKIKRVLSFNEFFNTAVLAQLLENTIGSRQYAELKDNFSYNKVNFNSFEDLTVKFSDIYRLENVTDYNIESSVDKIIEGPNFDEYYFDFSKLNYFLASSYLSDILDNKVTKNNILGLAHLYKITPQDMAKGIEKSVEISNGNSILNIDSLKNYFVQLYVNVRKQEVPTLDNMVSKKLVEEAGEELSEEDKFVREADNTNYISYLNKQKGLVISSVDARAIAELQDKYNFPTGVLNILLEYSINISNSHGLPHKNYIDKIASSWSGQKLLGAQDAIDYIRKIRNNRQNAKSTDKLKKVSNKNSTISKRNVYQAPFPEYLEERMKKLSVKKSSEQSKIMVEDEEIYNKMLNELNNKRNN